MIKPNRQIRVIAGQWRGRRLPVPDVNGLRPTPNRIRETLFNWLSDNCRGARVLDCCAGSGALGFEAISRGAKDVCLVEKNRIAFQNLVQQKKRLQADKIELIHADIMSLIPVLPGHYNVCFIDPPHRLPELKFQVLESLIKHAKLQAGAIIYLEWPQHEMLELPHSQLFWRRQKGAGQIQYAIVEWRPDYCKSSRSLL